MPNERETANPLRHLHPQVDRGLDQEYNSLDAQRDSGEAFIKSQQHEGWELVPKHYDDGGFTGGNMQRPALKRLMDDIKVGRVNCVVVYKVDRLSRSLMDFAEMMKVFDEYGVSFVSVTQQFNTSSSMGRLILNVLLSFAQFEREMISERTRDKIAMARRKGKYAGGKPVLGFDVVDKKLVANKDEAKRVNAIFKLYAKQQSLLDVCDELNARAWKTKSFESKSGTKCGGAEFTKNRLHYLLTNVLYVGQVRHKEDVFSGELKGIVPKNLFDQVGKTLVRNGVHGGREKRNKYGALLRGILCCASCECGMTQSFTTKGNRRYRYYVCNKAVQQGRKHCPSPSVPAAEIEKFVVEQIKAIGRDRALVKATVAEVRAINERRLAELTSKVDESKRELRRHTDAVGRADGDPDRLAKLLAKADTSRRRVSEAKHDLALHEATVLDDGEIERALCEFDDVWSKLSPAEKVRVIETLIERVDFDGAAGKVAIEFRSTGIKSLEVAK